MKLPTRPATFAVAVAVALAFAGCGGTSDGGLSATTQARLAPLVQQVRRAAETGDHAGAQRALTELQQAVATDRNNGAISPARAAQILTAAADVGNRLALVPTTTSTTTTTTTTPPSDKPGHGNKHNGNGGNGGND